MAEPEDRDLTTSIGAVLCASDGSLLVDLVTTDYESYSSSISPLRNIAERVTNEPSDELYGARVWIVDMHRHPSGQLFACDADGNVHTNAPGTWEVEAVSPGKGLRVIRCLPDGSVFSAGTAGVVFRRDPTGWTAVSESFGQWITGLDGRGASDIVVAGDAGFVAQLGDAGWSTPDLPTDATFHTVLAQDDRYLVGGANGVLFQGSGVEWADRTSLKHDLHALVQYRGEVWAACGPAGVGRLGSDGIEIMRSTFAAYVAHAADPFIAVAGNDIAVRFDGTAWSGRRYG